mmetsp:Transcript_28277/g.86454  ORF Transcript_28277/g.86454 Transcript_28277/m.86454 type:complete len:598 (-) Transcript_28277:2336-4129(-)
MSDELRSIERRRGPQEKAMPVEEEEEESPRDAAPRVGSPDGRRDSASASSSKEVEGSVCVCDVADRPGLVRRAARWVWNALSPKPELERRDRRRSIPLTDFGSPGGGGALRKPTKRVLRLPPPPPEPSPPDPPRRGEDRAYIVHSQVLLAWLRRSFPCPSCQADHCLQPGALARVWGSYGMLLNIECKHCGFCMQFRGGETMVMREELEMERKQKMYLSNEALRAVLGCLLSGTKYRAFVAQALAQQMEPIKRDAFESYVSRLAPLCATVCQDSISLVRYATVRYGWLFSGTPVIGDLIVTNDFFWATRGHHALNGTGTICELSSGGVLAAQHFCKRVAKNSTVQAYEATAKSMDARGFDSMLGEIVEWMEREVPVMCREYSVPVPPKFSGVVLDGDASTDKFVQEVERRARAASSSSVCAGLCVRPCVNHLAKNIGKKALEYGVDLHRSCSCAVRVRADGVTPFSSGARTHRGCCNGPRGMGLQKAMQIGMGAAMRGAVAMDRGPGQTVADVGIAAVEECLNHFFNLHDAPGAFTNIRRKCRFHEPGKESTHWNDCPQFLAPRARARAARKSQWVRGCVGAWVHRCTVLGGGACTV